MANVVEARDAYTGGHLWRVSQYSQLLAQKLGLPAKEVARIKVSGFLHDLGKVGVPDSILLKTGALTEDEYQVIKTHPVIGGEIIKEHPFADLVSDVIQHHHERVDGKGYPDNLRGEAFSLASRIVSIVDAFDAMTSTRPYRRGMPIDRALFILGEEREKQFDAELVQAFLAVSKSDALKHIVLHSDEGVSLVHCSMCGPIVHISRKARDGDIVYCHSCRGGLRLHREGQGFTSELTGSKGSASSVKPQADMDVVNTLVSQVPAVL